MRRIGLLIPFTEAAEYRPYRRGPGGRLRTTIRRGLERLQWRLRHDATFHFSTYAEHGYTNRGDSALRQASVELLQEAFAGQGGAAISEIGWEEVPRLDPARVAAGIELMVVGGGGYYYLDGAGELAPRLARELAWLRALARPVVSLSPGVNQVLADVQGQALHVGAPSRAVLGGFLDLLRLSSVRDAASAALLEDIRPGRTRVLADTALFLRPAGQALQSRSGDGPLIGLNLAFHGPTASRLLPGRVRLLAAIARPLAAEGARFVYFVHHETERLIPALLADLGVRAELVDAAPARLLDHYARLDAHLCQMLHSSILACNAGVPTVNLGYDVKNAAFFALMGTPELCLPADDTPAEAVVVLLRRVLAEAPARRQALAARKQALRAEMDGYLREVAGLLG